ncbi:MAG: hypothetical protein ACXWL5_03530 [Candidatus Chromulinivorax sp.]
MIEVSNHPTQLWIADQKTATTQIIDYLQKKLCSQNNCKQCVTCNQIAIKEHAWIIWLSPERSYTVEQIDEVIAQSSFTLDDQEKRYFIFDQAERLPDQCSNRLLKTIEEPNFGYHFFFLTSRAQGLPRTIQSRCLIQNLKNLSNLEQYKELLQPFLTLQFNNPINFIKQLESFDIKEQETKEIIDNLFEHWSKELKNELLKDNDQIDQNLKIYHSLVKILKQAIDNPPMTGGTKIFWKNLYIKTHYATKAHTA